MQKTIEDVIKILNKIAKEISENKITSAEAYMRIANLTFALEKGLPLLAASVEEKIDFLVFMQTKRSVSSGKPVMLAGEFLFDEWRKAKKRATEEIKQIPEEQI